MKRILDTLAALIVAAAIVVALAGVSLVATVLYTELTKEPSILLYMVGVLGGIITGSGTLVWAFNRLKPSN